MGWVKSHIGIERNEAADKEAKNYRRGVKQRVLAQRQEERQQTRWGLGKITRGGRRAVTWYTFLRTDRGPVWKWKKRLRTTNDNSCGKWGVQEAGWHLMFECPVNKESRKAKKDVAQTWEDLGNKGRIKESG